MIKVIIFTYKGELNVFFGAQIDRYNTTRSKNWRPEWPLLHHSVRESTPGMTAITPLDPKFGKNARNDRYKTTRSKSRPVL